MTCNLVCHTMYTAGNGWVGWKNDSFKDGYVDLVFEFDQIRNFSAVHLFTNNFFNRDVQVRNKFFFSLFDRRVSVEIMRRHTC